MRPFFSAGLALVVSLCAAGSAGAQSSDDKMGSMGSSMKSMSGMSAGHTIKMHAQNGSGESGTATLKQSGKSLLVTLSLTGGSGDQPAHIHKGTCAKLDPKPAYPLTTVADGKSETTLKGVTLAALMSGTYAINVHKSAADIKDYVACGDLKATAK